MRELRLYKVDILAPLDTADKWFNLESNLFLSDINTYTFLTFLIVSLLGKEYSYQRPQLFPWQGGEKKKKKTTKKTSIWWKMSKKFPEVVLSRQVSHKVPLHFHVNCTHKALHFRQVHIFPDVTDGQRHFTILQVRTRPFFISFLSSSLHSISFSWFLNISKFLLIFFLL